MDLCYALIWVQFILAANLRLVIEVSSTGEDTKSTLHVVLYPFFHVNRCFSSTLHPVNIGSRVSVGSGVVVQGGATLGVRVCVCVLCFVLLRFHRMLV
jgi:acetyltransferase-like isoleucine patch superfamily enzyme